MITKFDKAFWKYELLHNKFYTIALEYKNKNPTFKSNPTIKELADVLALNDVRFYYIKQSYWMVFSSITNVRR